MNRDEIIRRADELALEPRGHIAAYHATQDAESERYDDRTDEECLGDAREAQAEYATFCYLNADDLRGTKHFTLQLRAELARDRMDDVEKRLDRTLREFPELPARPTGRHYDIER